MKNLIETVIPKKAGKTTKTKKANIDTYAIHLITESSDHTTYCEQGTPEEIVNKIESEFGEEFGWISTFSITGLNGCETKELQKLLNSRIDIAREESDKKYENEGEE